ncbi:MAG: O-antigen ligase family protein [Candidatus Limnocylindrales bacterium]
MSTLAGVRTPSPDTRSRGPARWAVVTGIATVALAGGTAALVVASPLAAIAALGLGLLAMATVMRPAVATLFVVAALYSNAAVIAVRFHDVPFLVAAAVPALLLPPLAAFVILERRHVVITSAFPWIGLFLFVQLVSGLVSADTATAFDTVVIFLSEGIGLYFLLSNAVRTREAVISIVWILLLVGAVLGGLTFYQDATGTYDDNYLGFAQKSEAVIGVDQTAFGDVTQVRLAGNIGEKNRYAQVLLMLVPLGLFMAIAERRTWRRAVALGATALISLGVALTFSRGAAVGFALLLVIMFALGYVRPKHVVLVVIGVAVLFAAVPAYGERIISLVAVSSSVSDTGITEADGAIQSRITEGLAAVLAFADHPIVGVGPGQFPGVYREYAELVGIRVLASDRQAHNLFLGLAAELGLAGLTIFLIILGVTLRDLARARRAAAKIDPMLSALSTGFLLSIMTYLTTGIFLHMSFIRYFWMILALAAATAIVTMAVARRGEAVDHADGLAREGTATPPTTLADGVGG